MLGWQFVDLDERVEAVAGRPIREIFETEGEGGFRRLERVELEATLRRRRVVVATGGGTLAQAGALDSLQGEGLIVWLKAPFAELAARVEAAGTEVRPLFGDRRQARRLYRQRLPFYRQADLVLPIDSGQGVDGVVSRLTAELGIQACAT